MFLWLTLRRLNSSRPKTRLAAARRLAFIGSQRTTKVCEALLNRIAAESDSAVREASCEALGGLKNPSAVATLCRCLGEDESGVRRVAATALGKIATSDASDALLKALRNEGKMRVREALYDAVVAIGSEPSDPASRAWSRVAQRDWDAARTDPDSTFAVLRRLLELDDLETLGNAIAGLGTMPPHDLANLVATALGKSNYHFGRFPLLRAASRLRDALLVDPILAIMKAIDSEEREAIAGITDDAFFAHLRTNNLQEQRLAAVEALGETGDRSTIEILERLREQAQFEQDQEFVRAVGQNGVEGLGDALFKSLAGHLGLGEEGDAKKALGLAIARIAERYEER